ncbi:MAG: bile acid:sodium symporter [Alcanivorax sp.]
MIKSFVENNFNLVLCLSVVVGLLVPALASLPEETAIILISIAIFFSCSRVTVDELRHISLKSALTFYVIRFILLPIPIYYAAVLLIPEYAMGVLLLALAPSAASATAFAMVIRANPSLCLSATVVTNALTPISIPLILFFLGLAGDVEIDALDLFVTLSLAIFLPSLSYFLIFRRSEPVKFYMRDNAKFYATLSVGMMMAVVTSMQRDYFLNQTMDVLILAAIGTILYAVFLAVAWLFSLRMSFFDRKTYMVCSGLNNNGLVAGLAFLYFSPATILFIVTTEIPWTMVAIVMKYYADRNYERV